MKQYILSLGFVFLSLFIVTALVISRQESTDTRSKAAEQQQAIVPVKPLTVPKTNAVPQSLRLASEKQTIQRGERIPIDIYAYAPNLLLAEVKIALRIDNRYFLIEEGDIESLQVFPVYSLHSFSTNKILISLFITEEAGYEPVQLLSEQKIARIYLRAKDKPSTNVSLEFVLSESGMYAPRLPDGAVSSNQLRSVAGISFTIK